MDILDSVLLNGAALELESMLEHVRALEDTMTETGDHYENPVMYADLSLLSYSLYQVSEILSNFVDNYCDDI